MRNRIPQLAFYGRNVIYIAVIAIFKRFFGTFSCIVNKLLGFFDINKASCENLGSCDNLTRLIID